VLLVRYCSAMLLQYSSTWRQLCCQLPALPTSITSCVTLEIRYMMQTILLRLRFFTSAIEVRFDFGLFGSQVATLGKLFTHVLLVLVKGCCLWLGR